MKLPIRIVVTGYDIHIVDVDSKAWCDVLREAPANMLAAETIVHSVNLVHAQRLGINIATGRLLDCLGNEAGQGRRPGESDYNYRRRLRPGFAD